MKSIKSMLLYLAFIIIAFYMLPIFIIDTGSGMFMLLLVIPLICLIVSLIYGIKHGYNIYYSIIVTLLFTPTIFIYFNDSAIIYLFAYGFISFLGNYVGNILNKTNKNK